MKAFILVFLATLFCLSLIPATGCAATRKWPVESTIDFASGFGDYRTGRFHAGLDIRTGGRVGTKVYSPVSGYVKRVKTSYFGYGKGLYIAGDDGKTYVFGHLDQYAPFIDRPLKAAQYHDQQYSEDLLFPKDSLRVRAGEFVALSGQTGAGAPHLHFETRTAADRPLNPQAEGFTVKDKIRPTFSRVAIELADDRSLFPDGKRERYLSLQSAGKSGNYRVDSIPYMDRPFGLMVDCYDRMRAEGMAQAVYALRLYVDDSLWYESRFDTLDFASGQASYFEYDYTQAVDGKSHVRRLYRARGDEFGRSRAYNRANGVIGPDSIVAVGIHTIRVDAEDACGNRTSLTMKYRQGPATNACVLDSMRTTTGDTTRFYFTKCKEYSRLKFDSVTVVANQSGKWGPVLRTVLAHPDDDHLVATIVTRYPQDPVLALAHFAGGVVARLDQPFNGIRTMQAVRMRLEWDLTEDGLMAKVLSDERFAIWPKIILYYQGQRLGTEQPTQFFNMQTYYILIPPREQYARVDKIGLLADPDSTYPPLDTQRVNFAVVGVDPVDTLSFDNHARVMFTKDDVFYPRFVGVKTNKLASPASMGLASDHYQVLPAVFFGRKAYHLRMELPLKSFNNARTGLCWLDESADRWRWLGDNAVQGDTVTATASSGGSFAAVPDLEKPHVGEFSVPARSIIVGRRPTISFTIRDTLSGVADDKSIIIRLDKQWMIPEYDPEENICRFQPPEDLAYGEHHISVSVTDRAGNTTEQFLIFTIIEDRKTVGEKSGGATTTLDKRK